MWPWKSIGLLHGLPVSNEGNVSPWKSMIGRCIISFWNTLEFRGHALCFRGCRFFVFLQDECMCFTLQAMFCAIIAICFSYSTVYKHGFDFTSRMKHTVPIKSTKVKRWHQQGAHVPKIKRAQSSPSTNLHPLNISFIWSNTHTIYQSQTHWTVMTPSTAKTSRSRKILSFPTAFTSADSRLIGHPGHWKDVVSHVCFGVSKRGDGKIWHENDTYINCTKFICE